ncbi:UNVERIFIED_CONTAM: hypothetical protein FKN15_021823 [Acipenser sinensis]
MHPPQSYSVRGQRSLQASPQVPGQFTGVAGARPTMHPPQSYSVRGQRSLQASPQVPGQFTGVAGARNSENSVFRPDYL